MARNFIYRTRPFIRQGRIFNSYLGAFVTKTEYGPWTTTARFKVFSEAIKHHRDMTYERRQTKADHAIFFNKIRVEKCRCKRTKCRCGYCFLIEATRPAQPLLFPV